MNDYLIHNEKKKNMRRPWQSTQCHRRGKGKLTYFPLQIDDNNYTLKMSYCRSTVTTRIAFFKLQKENCSAKISSLFPDLGFTPYCPGPRSAPPPLPLPSFFYWHLRNIMWFWLRPLIVSFLGPKRRSRTSDNWLVWSAPFQVPLAVRRQRWIWDLESAIRY